MLRPALAALLLLLLAVSPCLASPRAEADDLTNQAESLGAKNHWEDALPLLDKATRTDPTDAHAWAIKGAALGILGRYDEALQCADKVIQLEPKSANGYMLRGEVNMSRKDYGPAEAAFKQAVQVEGDDGRTWVAHGGALLAMGQYARAADDFKKATDLLPGYDFAWYNRGVALDHLKDYSRALYCLEQASFLNSKSAPTCREKGLVLYRMKRKQESRAAFVRAIRLDARERSLIPPEIIKDLKLSEIKVK